jgi:hypothetical protein
MVRAGTDDNILDILDGGGAGADFRVRPFGGGSSDALGRTDWLAVPKDALRLIW